MRGRAALLMLLGATVGTAWAEPIEPCLACHGAAASAPRLDGQPADYLAKQLLNLRDADRPQAPTLGAAHALASDTARRLAEAFSARPRPAWSPPAAPDSPGARLYRRGDDARYLLACASCHGSEQDESVSPVVPWLAGQAPDYLQEQLGHWRDKRRSNSRDGVMNLAAEALSDADIAALVAYLGRR
jgi:cytochrome c553